MFFRIKSPNFTKSIDSVIIDGKVIIREEYLHKLKVFKDKNIIKIVTGIRRCGKSTLLLQFRDWLIGHGVRKSQINLINFEDLEYEDLTDYKSLHKYIKEHLKKNVKTYVFKDEIQSVLKFLFDNIGNQLSANKIAPYILPPIS